MISVTLFECNGWPIVVTHSTFQKCLEQKRVLIWSVSLRKTFKKKNQLETLGGLCNNVFNDALSAVMYVDGYSSWNVSDNKMWPEKLFSVQSNLKLMLYPCLPRLFNDCNASCHQPNGNAQPVFNVTKWCPTTIDYNMTYTWFWTAHGSAGKHKYQCFHYLFVYVETASLVLGKHPRVFSKRLLHIINKNVKVSFSCFSNCLHFSGRYITVLHSLINSCCFYSFQSNHYCHFHVCVRLKTLEGF